ncbi:MAG: insulinase family protein, partial [Chloroflexota bacterium]
MNLHGFELLRKEAVDEINATARLYRHVQTGAELLSMEIDDENKSFGISFRTPPSDSTGIAHIMEHSVLGGSRKYQVKEPFVELVKGSFKTFLNAITFPDKTVYPVASTNLQDFYNLVDIYLDAVFHPLITPFHLQQEGWHYELNKSDEPLIYKGVVFNEMKGAYSSPDSLLHRNSKTALFPDNAYVHDSGGDPMAIPDLTYEQFKKFHETYYHPSNALIYFYGDDPEEERLRLLNEYLVEFDAQDVDGSVALQRPFSEPKRVIHSFSVEADSEQSKKGMVQLNWLLPENNNAELTMGLSILSYALVSTNGSPLRKVLIDSGLGEDLTGGGLGAGMRQLTFAVGMKGVANEQVDQVESLILDTLGKIAEDGIDPNMIEAALNTFEFSLRENNTGSFPRGLSVMFRALRTWAYGLDPLSQVRYEGVLTAVKQNIATNPTYLQDLIGEHLLNNSHRVTVVMEPDPEMSARLETEEKAKLTAVQESLTDDEVQNLISETEHIRAMQERPDDPEALAALPTLQLSDLEPKIRHIPLEISEAGGTKILYHDLFTNGIVYLDVGFNMRSLPLELMPYVGLFTSGLTGLGTHKEDYVKLSQRIGAKTGGLSRTAERKLDAPTPPVLAPIRC